MKTIEVEELLKEHTDEDIGKMVSGWQSSEFLLPLTCGTHPTVPLEYINKELHCGNPDCDYHQSWVPMALLSFGDDAE